jgi:phosphoserine phosphatase RsbU/P
VYEQADVQLEPGDLLTLYTDGVTEAQSEDDEFWGEERLIDRLRSQRHEPCRKILRDILNDVRAFTGDQGQTDDITMVAARWTGP